MFVDLVRRLSGKGDPVPAVAAPAVPRQSQQGAQKRTPDPFRPGPAGSVGVRKPPAGVNVGRAGSAQKPPPRPRPPEPALEEEDEVPTATDFGRGDPSQDTPGRSFGTARPDRNRRILAIEPETVDGDGSEGGALVPVPSGEVGLRARRIVADDDQMQSFMDYQGDVLTASGGPLATTDKQRRHVAFFADGTLLIDRDAPLAPAAMEVKDQLRKSGRRVRQEYHVPLDIIRKVHESADKRMGDGQRNTRRGESLQQMQHMVLDLIAEAAGRRASDIHITVERHEATVRMRCDGVVEAIKKLPSVVASDLCAAAFNMADASDASYRPLEYQGARISEIRTPLPPGVQSIRLQFNPLPNQGRYLIARLLYANSAAQSGGDVDTLGYSRVHVEQIKRMRRRPYGINVISGPTGSGKSTTLKRALTALMQEKRFQITVITIEDPPEYVIAGAAQLPVTNAQTDEERAEKFRGAIAAALRSDPDVIMIGEIRDKASASLAFAAAMTGHQVWASLHANDAISILDRFRDQGVDLYKLGDPTLVTGLIGQRLIRRLCPRCRISFKEGVGRGLLTTDQISQIERVAAERISRVCLANPEPPEKCGCRGGYSEREVLAETIVPDLEFMRCIRQGDKEGAVNYWIEKLNGMSMIEHAAQKMVDGLCDPRDVEDKAGELIEIRSERLADIFGRLYDEKPGM
jgi:type II secretory ATPase GspE/PulE/Tfp pilus assembly ATPase PilB-like protein